LWAEAKASLSGAVWWLETADLVQMAVAKPPVEIPPAAQNGVRADKVRSAAPKRRALAPSAPFCQDGFAKGGSGGMLFSTTDYPKANSPRNRLHGFA
jgi:hypothetical protein